MPDSAAILAELQKAAALSDAGRLDEAERMCERVLAGAPDHFDALHQLALIKARQGKFDDALLTIDRALAVVGSAGHPNAAGAHLNRGNLLRALNRPAEALAAFDAVIALDPALLGAYNNRGNVLWQLGRGEEAIADYRHILRLKPNQPDALLNCGRALAGLKRFDEAYACYDKLLALDPNHFAGLYNYGTALEDDGKPDQALVKYKRAHALNADHFGAAYGLLTLQMDSFDWQGWEALAGQVVDGVRAGKTGLAPFNFLHLSDRTDDQLRCARTWSRSQFPSVPPLWTGERYAHDRIRVAYLSSDLREHAVAYLTAGLFEHHDRGRFEITAVSAAAVADDAMRRRLAPAFDRFIDVPDRSDRDIAVLLREMEIDIAVDLNGHTIGARAGALAHRPAPVAVNYLGFPATMGADWIDYIIADRYVVPDAESARYSESVVRLPDAFQVNDANRRVATTTPTRGAMGLPERGFVFCGFSRNAKITSPMFDLWMSLLAEIPESVLWLVGGGAPVESNLRAEARRRGVDPARLVFAGRASYPDHLARHACADLCLDTLPFNGGTTTSDALFMGLPVLTVSGEAFAARMAGSLLTAIGLPELIASSLEDYRDRALMLAKNPAALAEIKARLARNKVTSPLFDTARFCRHLERAFVTMWERTQRGEKPASFAVEKIV